MSILKAFICLIAGHSWLSVSNRYCKRKQRKCSRCKCFQVMDYWGKYRNFRQGVTELYPKREQN